MKERLRKPIEYGMAAVTVYYFLTSAFSKSTREEIKERDNNACTACGATMHLEASHKDHTKDEDYNNPERGEMLDTRCHYMYHLNHRDDPEELGLSEQHNEYAINSLYGRMPKLWRDSVPQPECDDKTLLKWNKWIYGDEDYWKNRDGILIENWPVQMEMKFDDNLLV